MGKKEQVPARAIFVQGSLWVWSATSRGRPPDGGLALAVFHIVPRVPAAPNLFVHPPAYYLSATRLDTGDVYLVPRLTLPLDLCFIPHPQRVHAQFAAVFGDLHTSLF